MPTFPAGPSPSLKADRLAPYLVVALTLFGGTLRILALDSKGLWLDEAFSVWLARQPLPDLYAWLLKIDQHPRSTMPFCMVGSPRSGMRQARYGCSPPCSARRPSR